MEPKAHEGSSKLRMIFLSSDNERHPVTKIYSLQVTTLHHTFQHFTSSNLNFTQVHFTILAFGLTPFQFPTAPFHLNITALHLTSFRCTFRRFLPHFFLSLHSFLIPFLTLFLKILDLQGKAPNVSAGSWFQFLMVLFTNEYLPISVLFFPSLFF